MDSHQQTRGGWLKEYQSTGSVGEVKLVNLANDVSWAEAVGVEVVGSGGGPQAKRCCLETYKIDQYPGCDGTCRYGRSLDQRGSRGWWMH
jgi:hypothetical protein